MDNRLIIACDHGGFDLKESLKDALTKKGYEITDLGTNSKDSVDYPDYACALGAKVGSGEFNRGIVICTSGIGVSICANKSKGVRAALCMNEEQAMLSRQHNNANVLALGAKYVSLEDAVKISEKWLTTDFEGGRHERRVNKISDFEC